MQSVWENTEAGFSSVKSMFISSPQPTGFMDEVNSQLTMSWSRRIIGFVSCVLLGGGLVFLSTFFLLAPRSFGKFYTLGNLLLLGSTLFLVGPYRQFKNMCGRERAFATTIYIVTMLATLYTAVGLQSRLLTLPMIIIQMAAALWYGASYIPFAQDCLRGSASTILPV